MDLIGDLWTSMAITGKTVVTILAILSIYSYAVMVDRGVALRGAMKRSNGFADAVEGRELSPEPLLAETSAFEEQSNSSLATVVGAGLSEFKVLRSAGRSDDAILEMVEDATGRAVDVAIMNLRLRLAGMATIAGVAPFLGLLGTVTGLIAAFRGIAEAGSGGLATVSGGISEALVTTVIGLFVAIPALGAYNFLMNRIDIIGVELDNSASRMVNHAVWQGLQSNE